MTTIKPLGRKAYGHIPHLPGSRLGPGDHKIEAASETSLDPQTETKARRMTEIEERSIECAALRKRLAEVKKERDSIGDAYDRLVSAVIGEQASAAFCFDTTEYEKQAERARIVVDSLHTLDRLATGGG